ncbi:MAG: hypothetical protein ACE14S_05510 [Candidatus Bathyarchaeia archaeon]
MKRTAVTTTLTILAMAIILPMALSLQVQAQTAGYTIQTVDHSVELLYSGHTIITDTITLTGQTPNSFPIGFPFKYGAYLLKSMAYDANNRTLPMTLGVQLEDQSGYYGAEVTLPPGTSQPIKVIFILSNALLTTTSMGYSLDFPAYPSLTQTASECKTTIALPQGIESPTIDKPDGQVNGTAYSKTNLPALSYSPATASYQTSFGYLQQVNIPTMTRQISIDPSGALSCTETYRITNNSTSFISSFEINLPLEATSVVARDEFGRVLQLQVDNTVQNGRLTLVANATLILISNPGESTLLTVDYKLPSIKLQQAAEFMLNLDLFAELNYYVDAASVTVVPPEGARITQPQLSEIEASTDLSRNAFQEALTINRNGVTFLDSVIPSQDIVQVTYEYNSLWIAFRPTIWMWAIAIVGSVIAALVTRPKAKAPARIMVPKLAVGLSPEHIKTFTNAYEEKNRLLADIATLEARAQKGRIPRRRYKVQRRTWELRLQTLDQTIKELKELLRNAGGSYADVVRQLETAEAELEEVETGIKSIEARNARGDLPLEAYKRQLADFQRRKEKAETTVNGLLLRLRGEIR